MNIFEKLRSDWIYITGFQRIVGAITHVKAETQITLGDEIERLAAEHGERPFILFEGREWTYAAIEARASQFANWGLAHGLKPGDCVALFMENRPDYIAFWLGMAKIAVRTALINYNLVGAGLAHCISVVNSKAVVTTPELAPALLAAQGDRTIELGVWSLAAPSGGGSGAPAPAGLDDFDAALLATPSRCPDRSVRAGVEAAEVALYIYTSGTTGLPKAAKISTVRAIGLMRAFASAAQIGPHDRVLMTLPLYHATGGMCGVGAALYSGGLLALQRKFSASQFWHEAIDTKATVMVYIGELNRYLMNQPPTTLERSHAIVKGFGNGLRPDVWAKFVERTGIRNPVEFYGSTEGNVSYFNLDGRIGAVGRLPRFMRGLMKQRLVKFDVDAEQPVRGMDGFCIEAAPDEPGEAIGPISEAGRQRFDGYNDPEQTKKKILRDVFEKGDAWFRTGDLMRMDADGYVYFVDRVGDTFRWKSENVSTGEVELAISAAPGVAHAVVYGVKIPNQDGRAGMAAITAAQPEGAPLASPLGAVDLRGLYDLMLRQLPAYARPVFLRFTHAAETTGTFKYRKVDLVAEGFDPSKVADPLFMADPAAQTYAPITAEMFANIQAGKMRF